MTIYVDPLVAFGWRLRGKTIKNCHLFTDGPIDELHALATRIGMQRSWFQISAGGVPHYDLAEGGRIAAIAEGAVEVDRHQAVAIWREIKKRAIDELDIPAFLRRGND